MTDRAILLRALILGAACVLMTGCDMQSQGFNLPPGDAEQGKATFILMQCNDCHSIEGPPAPRPRGRANRRRGPLRPAHAPAARR